MSLCTWKKLCIGSALFLPTFALFLIVNWPAFTDPWFALDDYYAISVSLQEMIQLFLAQGRPLYPFIMTAVKVVFVSLPSLQSASILLHLLQAAIHTLVAVIIGLVMVQKTYRRIAYLTMLPFLLWPVNETALWISAISYPIAGLLSVTGVLLIDNREAGVFRKLSGFLLIIASLLTAQSASLTGLSLAILGILLSRREDVINTVQRSLLWIIAAYLTGGISTTLMTVLLRSYRVMDAPFFSLHSAGVFFIQSVQLLALPPNFPVWIKILYTALIILGPAVAILALLIRPRTSETFLRIGAILLAMVALIIVPGIPFYALGLPLSVPRRLFAGPLVFTGALCLLLIPELPRKLFTGVMLLFVALLMLGYVSISFVSAKEYVTTYKRDLQRLHMLEREAESEGVSTIVISNLPERLTTRNPYRHRYYSGDAKKSSFGFAWASTPMITVLSESLKVIHDKNVTALCTGYCTSAPFDPTAVEDSLRLTVLRTEQRPVLCYCP